MFTNMNAAQKQAAKKKENMQAEVAIPENVQLNINGSIVSVKGQKGELKRDFIFPNIAIARKDSKVVISADNVTKKEKAVINAFAAHLNNMFTGVTKGYKYKLKIVFSHFPVTAKVAGDKLEITNFLGEKAPRIAKIFGNAKITAGKEEIVIEGIDVESVGQTAANIEQATKIRYKDIRVFQDGIYLTSRE